MFDFKTGCTIEVEKKCTTSWLLLCNMRYTITGHHLLHILSLSKAKFLLNRSDNVAHDQILLDGSDWEIQSSDSKKNGFRQEQRFSISNSPLGALSFCSSLSLHLVTSIALFTEQWNGLSGSSVQSGVFVRRNKRTDGPQTGSGSCRREVCMFVSLLMHA